MKLSDKLRYLREVEGMLRGLGRTMTQQELVRAIAEETDGGSLSQSYLSQIESGSRPHLTNTTRLLLARFFKVHPGYLVEDPEDFQAEFRTAELAESLAEDRLDLWLIAGAERFGRSDPKLCRALLTLAKHADTRGCVLLLEAVLETPTLAERLMAVLQPRPEEKTETGRSTPAAGAAKKARPASKAISATADGSPERKGTTSGTRREAAAKGAAGKSRRGTTKGAVQR